MTPIKLSWTPAQFSGFLYCVTAYMAYHFSGYTAWGSEKRLFVVLAALAVHAILGNLSHAVPRRMRSANL